MARLACIVLSAIICVACSRPLEKDNAGQQLASAYCGSCHEVPSPGLLTKQVWLTGVLPQMGPRLGIREFQGTSYPINEHPTVPKGYYPEKATITDEQWAQIVGYYFDEAPDSLPSDTARIEPNTYRFTVRMPVRAKNDPPPVSSYVKIDPGNHGIYVGQGVELALRSYNTKLDVVSRVPLTNVMADIAFDDLAKPGTRSGTLLVMGALTPYDVVHGSLFPLWVSPNLVITLSSKTIADSLSRPVSLVQTDLDGDGGRDYIVCGFGNFTGSLFILKETATGYQRTDLRNLPGSSKAIVADFNNDGRKDILALMAQSDEGIFLYEQTESGEFLERNILRFSPVAGSVSIDLADFNGDSFPDIVYASGDNADFSKTLKPYHGVYIFINDGKFNFKQQFFFPINGCFKALARDFDLDGDFDIASISYFPDFLKRPEESFVYLENQGGYNFKAASVPQHNLGRWLTMDADDLDGDGDDDIILGNMSIGPTNIPVHADFRSGPAFLLLENKTR